MKRFSRIVFWLLLVELVVGVAIGTRIRAQLERPTTYLGSTCAAGPTPWPCEAPTPLS